MIFTLCGNSQMESSLPKIRTVRIACSCNEGLPQQPPLQPPAPSALGLLMKPQNLLLEESRSMIQLRL